MVLFLFFSLGSYVWAQSSDFILSMESSQPGIGATWSFPLFVGEDWFLASGQGGDLTVAPMDEAGRVYMEEVQTVTDVGIIKDHALRMCPNGQFVYAASTGIEDDVLVYTLDVDFQIQTSDILPQSNPLHAGNDMSAICSSLFQGVGVAELQGLRDYFYPLDVQGELEVPIELSDAPRMTGAGLWEHDGMMYSVGRDGLPELSVAVYDTQLDLQEQYLIPPISPEIMHYWSSSVLRVEDYFLLISMGRDAQDNWPLDTGNVYMAVLTHDMQLVEWIQLTDFEPTSGGGMRPWMERAQDQLWISYDRNNLIELISIELFLDAFVDEVDEPSPEPTEEPSQEPSIEEAQKEGGCAGVMLAPLLLLLRRKTYETS